jgi:hypothetical protein
MASDFNFSDTTPAAPISNQNVKWQKDGSSPANISAYIPVGSSLGTNTFTGNQTAPQFNAKPSSSNAGFVVIPDANGETSVAVGVANAANTSFLASITKDGNVNGAAANFTAFNGTTGNLTNINSTGTAALATVTASAVTASGTVKAGVFAGQGSASITAGSTTVTGTSPSLAVYGSGASGEIDFTVGSSPSASGLIATINFPTSYPSAPKAIIVPNGTSLPPGFSWDTTTSAMTISCSSVMSAGAFYKLEYILMA